MTEESATLPPPPPAPPLNQTTKQRLNPHEIRNVDLVQRFLAATPSYLYSPPPIGPPNFFFSEMLRSLVQSKAAENARNLQNPMRRPRKRLWTPPNRFETENHPHAKESNGGGGGGEKPLELTTSKHQPMPFASAFNPLVKLTTATSAAATVKDAEKIDSSVVSTNSATEANAMDTKLPTYVSNSDGISNEPSAASLPPSDLITPPIPPIWYPPLYPPYGIDPLHFFIDLRVSGQLYDRKKENCSPSSNENAALGNENILNNNNNNNNNNNHIGKARHGSAFSVPPRRDQKSPLALNLSAISAKSNAIDFVNNNNNNNNNINNNNCSDLLDDKSRNTNYVLQNLPRIYTSLTGGNPNISSDHERHSDESESNKSSSDIDVKDHEQISNFSDDVVIVDQDIDGQHERKYLKRK